MSLTKNKELEDRFIGCFTGGAGGDALGLPMESLSRSDKKRRYGDVVKDYIKMREYGLGTYSDDTQLTLAVAEALIRANGFSIKETARAFKEWIPRRISEGRTTLEAIVSLEKDGSNWKSTGKSSDGCGAAMRASPIGLFYHNDINALLKYAAIQSFITHKHSLAIDGSKAIAYSVAYALQHCKNFDPKHYLSSLYKVLGEDSELRERVKYFYNNLNKNVTDVAQKGIGTTCVIDTVDTAIFCVAKSPYDFEKTIVTAINIGGDVDSIAGMAGSISGAINGINGIPRRWVEGLENGKGGNKEKGRDYIIKTARRLYRKSK